ncbi:MAG: DUF4973 domain-containing protein [Muribaculaceae bacterium]|nr:DUF4973 domain-containing protein [Muribaculaceae bacterium]
MNILKIQKYLFAGAAAMLMLPALTACNDEWTEEQYTQYVSFKAPLDTEGSSVGVTTVYVPYTRVDENGNPIYGENGLSSYNLPVIISGSTENDRDVTAHVAHSDTLQTLNIERFNMRSELWYNDMSQFASYPESIVIPKGQNIGLLPISLDFRGIDLNDRYVLPLTVVDAPQDGCLRNPRKNFATAMLRILPYTDYSGVFQAPNVKYYLVSGGVVDEEPGALSTVQTYVVDENTVFFYAGTFNESSQLRKYFKIYARFNPNNEEGTLGSVEFFSDDEQMALVQNKPASYNIIEQADEVQSYIMRRTLIISDIDYTFNDCHTAAGSVITYNVTGNMTMERKLNTQMPVEDQIVFE